ncbi:hypothetical protein DES53_101476 [Roseimicrobium gellanilyticum]|uniref:Uncharacterized protein n=1 Tax=Roseimicrobium gellanilyticum TaxID=748857 RepID=A0A366HWK5_9BACT|nr:hypothetical protein [Roseimicrobium gellanilyticum]RBP47678.1 hypothetical protein DES53_101476 [Roseimicrobium gellanilyticum]
MKKTAPWILLALVIASVAVSKAVEPDDSWHEVKIRHLDATDVAQALVKESEDLAEALVRIDVRRNSILLDAESPSFGAAAKKLADLDQPPKLVIYKMEITEMVTRNDKTKERIVFRPTIHAMEGKPAEVTHQIDKERLLKISVVSTITSIAKGR